MDDLRIDFHVHSRISPDALDHPEDIVRRAKSLGLHGIAITDHDRAGAYARLVDLGLADPSGRPVDGFLVLPGVEVSADEGHILVIGAAWDSRPGISAASVVARAHSLGAVAIAAHPFDVFRSGVGPRTLASVPFDAVETFNSKTFARNANANADRWARTNGLAEIGGSDAHFAACVGRAHTRVSAHEFSVSGVLGAVRAGRTLAVEGLHTPTELARYLLRGWCTRPWLIDLSVRSAGKWARHCGFPDTRPEPLVPSMDVPVLAR